MIQSFCHRLRILQYNSNIICSRSPSVVCRTVFYGSRYGTGVSRAVPWRVESPAKTAVGIRPTTVTVRCAALLVQYLSPTEGNPQGELLPTASPWLLGDCTGSGLPIRIGAPLSPAVALAATGVYPCTALGTMRIASSKRKPLLG